MVLAVEPRPSNGKVYGNGPAIGLTSRVPCPFPWGQFLANYFLYNLKLGYMGGTLRIGFYSIAFTPTMSFNSRAWA
jgi:hypothetical protein